MAALIGLSEEVIGRRFELEAEKTRIGRDPGNHIIVDNGTVSGEHCYLFRSGGAISIQDLGSTNGITVNSQLVQVQELKANDIIEVGSIAFRVELESADVPVAAPPEPPAESAPSAVSSAPSFAAEPGPAAPSASFTIPSSGESVTIPMAGAADHRGESPPHPRSFEAVYLGVTIFAIIALAVAVLYYINLIMN